MERNGFDCDVSEGNTECGIGRFRPKCLQHFANINAFVGVYSIVTMISQVLSFYVDTQVPDLEKLFGLSSTESGLLMGFNDIGFLAAVLFVSAAARYVHIPRMLCLCILLYGFSGLICSLPHFVTVSRDLLPTPNLNASTSNTSNENSMSALLCKPENNLTEHICESGKRDEPDVLAAPSYPIKTLALGLIGVGMTLQGIGKAPGRTFYLMYIDDNVDHRKTGFYTGIYVSYLVTIFCPMFTNLCQQNSRFKIANGQKRLLTRSIPSTFWRAPTFFYMS
jgi:MFS family permease